MKDYWLAKLISSVTEVDSRKRLQKSIYLLQHADCPLHFRYILHCYGPYSFELAGLINQLDGADIIDESQELTGFGGVRYRSKISEKGKAVLKKFQKSDAGKEMCELIKPFIPLFRKLTKADAPILELAATVAYFYEESWPEAVAQTRKFKHLEEDDRTLEEATEIAGEFINRR